MRRYWLIAVVALIALWAWSQRAPESALPASGTGADDSAQQRTLPADAEVQAPAWLPEEARDTLRLIERGGPFPHRQDGSTFQNREGRLPAQPRGYYREYTVRTPGSRDRGARRIVAGGDPPREFFYSDDHYRSFRRFDAETTP
ncbi:ribonuclease domain-containing protein [Luteimonas aquatica]|uniref:ribonuclease domain-containing protein n=1 Tax=Luteimonas aquatica TaxID=450364 RepID=UPI001F5951CD|nr:ribonuclease domain-containing protein [Luteimonas aquatica]